MGETSRGPWQCISSDIWSVEVGPPLRSQEIGAWGSMRGSYTLYKAGGRGFPGAGGGRRGRGKL
eukprot:4950453-Pyramimonas_sp.AAC.1